MRFQNDIEAPSGFEDHGDCAGIALPLFGFLAQDAAWRHAVLPPGGRFVSIEAGVTDYWHRFIGPAGLAIGIDTFGESAPLAPLQEHFGLTPAKIAARVAEWAKGR